MMTQIYSVLSLKEAETMLDCGVTHIGINPVRQPHGSVGEISYETAQQIIAGVAGRGKVTVLALENDAERILEKAELLHPDVLQIAGSDFHADRALVAECKRRLPFMKIMQAVQVVGACAIDQAKEFGSFVDYLILDSGSSAGKGIGASGCTHDWNISRRIVETCGVPVVLAGGLGCDNVAQAVAKVQPWGVDSLTKTNAEAPTADCAKDPEKVRLFCNRAKAQQA